MVSYKWHSLWSQEQKVLVTSLIPIAVSSYKSKVAKELFFWFKWDNSMEQIMHFALYQMKLCFFFFSRQEFDITMSIIYTSHIKLGKLCKTQWV